MKINFATTQRDDRPTTRCVVCAAHVQSNYILQKRGAHVFFVRQVRMPVCCRASDCSGYVVMVVGWLVGWLVGQMALVPVLHMLIKEGRPVSRRSQAVRSFVLHNNNELTTHTHTHTCSYNMTTTDAHALIDALGCTHSSLCGQ